MAELSVVEELRAYLIGQTIVQAQSNAPSTSLPSVWLMPRDGAPKPRTGENLTVTLIDTNTSGPPGLEAWITEVFVDIRIRSRTAGPAKLLARTIEGKLAPIGDIYGRKNWLMNNLLVEYSTGWRGLQPVGADDTTYDFVQSFRFGVRRSLLST